MNKEEKGEVIETTVSLAVDLWIQEVVPFLACVGAFLAMRERDFSMLASVLLSFAVYSLLSSLARMGVTLIGIANRWAAKNG